MYHRYQHGYHVRPDLNRLGDGPVFERDTGALLDRYLGVKAAAMATRDCCLVQDCSDEILEAVCDLIERRYPQSLRGPRDFESMVAQIQEDVLVIRTDADRDWVCAAHVCMPSSWNPANVIGNSFETVHQPVPGMDLTHSRRIVEAMIHHGPFERFQWGVFFEDRLDYHPQHGPRKSFDPQRPFVQVKVERQVTVGFPDLGAAAFILRQHVIPEYDLDRAALANAVEGMTDAQRSYKGITQSADGLIRYLRSSGHGKIQTRRGRE